MKAARHDSATLAATPPASGAAQGAHAVVIGSGFGGLAAAVRLSCRGYRVTVLEKLEQPGGRAAVWQQDGFTFDAGPTIVTAPFFFEELWQLAGRRLSDDVALRPLDPFYRVRFDDGTQFDYSGDAAAMRAQIERIAPADVRGYDRFMRASALAYKLGFEKLGAVAYNRFGELFAALPDLVRMRGWRSLHRQAARCFADPRLRILFSLQSLLIGGNPFSVPGVYSLIHTLERRFGVHWAMGGTGALVRGLVRLLAARGVPVICHAEVKQILVEPRGDRPRAVGVELQDGTRLAADIVVSNADTAWTYRHLVAPQFRRHWTDRRIERQKYSMSLFVWYFGTDRRFDEVPHHSMVLGPRYQALLADIFQRHRLPWDFSLYLHRPTATDASMAPPGCDAFYALAPVPHLDSGTDWHAVAEQFRQAVARRLHDTVLPGFERHIVTSRTMTPLDFQERLLSYKGAAFGAEPLLRQSAWFRAHNRSEDIDRLFMVGAGTHPGAGLPGVLLSAQMLDGMVPAPHRLA